MFFFIYSFGSIFTIEIFVLTALNELLASLLLSKIQVVKWLEYCVLAKKNFNNF